LKEVNVKNGELTYYEASRYSFKIFTKLSLLQLQSYKFAYIKKVKIYFFV